MAGLVAFPAGHREVARGVANNLDGLTHDLRNVMASLQLCAEVLGQPEVLMPGHEYLAGEVRAVTGAAIGLLRRVGTLTESCAEASPGWWLGEDRRGGRVATMLADLEGLLRRVAGPGVCVEVECASCWGRTAMPVEDFGRVLVNLVRNASEAMPKGGRVRVTAQLRGGQSFAGSRQGMQTAKAVMISVQDDGPGVPKEIAGQIFRPGFTTKPCAADGKGNAGKIRRGLGLATARELVEMAGGRLRLVPSARGTCFEIEIPLTNVMRRLASRTRFEGEGGRA